PMKLFRIYGFAVTPQRTSDEKVDPAGGAFKVTPELREALDGLFVSSKLGQQSIVDFRIEAGDSSTDRNHPVRAMVMWLWLSRSVHHPKRRLLHRRWRRNWQNQWTS